MRLYPCIFHSCWVIIWQRFHTNRRKLLEANASFARDILTGLVWNHVRDIIYQRFASNIRWLFKNSSIGLFQEGCTVCYIQDLMSLRLLFATGHASCRGTGWLNSTRRSCADETRWMSSQWTSFGIADFRAHSSTSLSLTLVANTLSFHKWPLRLILIDNKKSCHVCTPWFNLIHMFAAMQDKRSTVESHVAGKTCSHCLTYSSTVFCDGLVPTVLPTVVAPLLLGRWND